MAWDTSIFTGFWALWMAAGFLSGLAVVGLFGRGPIRLFVPFLRILMLPLRPVVFILRRLRLIPKSASKARSARNAVATLRVASNQNMQNQSEIETALALPDEEELEGVEVEVAPYDYSGVRQSIKTEGVLFKSISVRPGFFPILLTSPMSEEIGEAYLNEARIFFNRRPALKVNHRALFEDADGAVAISMFRRFDRNAYYLLNEMRKVINDNARRLMLTFSVLLLAATGLVFAAPVEAYQKLAGCVVVMVLMAVAQTFGYKNQQQHAIRELRSFLTRYLGRISDRFREVTGNARGVTVGDETDSQMLSTSAIKWHKVMMWLPFRTFFIETFVRNVLYQIDRNSGYYLYIFVPALAVCAAIVGYSISEGLFTPPTRDTLVEHYPLLGYLGVIIVYFHYITKVVIADELDQADWLGFDDLNVSAAMDEVVGKYAEDVGFWKGRFDR